VAIVPEIVRLRRAISPNTQKDGIPIGWATLAIFAGIEEKIQITMVLAKQVAWFSVQIV
jgi:hypothetical protein